MNSLVLVQHCQSQHHVNREARLWPDRANGLTDFGRRQAECIAARLQASLRETPCSVYASDMARALETAEIIGGALGTPVAVEPALREYNGRFAVERSGLGKEWPNDEEKDKREGNWSLFDYRPFPGAETWREFHGRVSALLDQLRQGHDPQGLPIFVVHGGTLNNMVVWWLGLELDALPERTPFSASPASISVLSRSKFGNPVLGRLNDRSHLYAAGLLNFDEADVP